MLAMPGKQLSPVGVSFDSRSIIAVQLARRGGRWQLAAAGELRRTAPGAGIDRRDMGSFRAMLRRRGFQGNRIVLALPEEKLCCGVLELPPRSSGAPLEEIAISELARMHGYDEQAAEAFCWDLPPSARSKEGSQVMAVACRHADAEALTDVFDGMGMDVIAVDSPLCAAVRACRPRCSAGITAILNLGWDCATLMLVYQGEVIYQKVMPEAATKRLFQLLARRLGLEEQALDHVLAETPLPGGAEAGQEAFGAIRPAIKGHVDAILVELEATFSYATYQYPNVAVDCLLLVGCGAAVPGLQEYCRSRLGINAYRIAPAELIDLPPSLAGVSADARLTIPIGLASSLSGDSTRSMNFLPASRRHARRRWRRLRLWTVGGLAYMALLAGGYLLALSLWGADPQAYASELDKTRANIQRADLTIQVMKRELQRADLALQAHRAAGNHPDWSLLLTMLAESLNDEVVLKQCELKPVPTSASPASAGADQSASGDAPYLLKLAGYGRTHAAVSQFVLQLERTGAFDLVKLTRTVREPFMSDSAILFQLDCSLGGKAGSPK
jgi:Tfp pilus assembly PilM family ATPase/Tfp pilus assembly protein PilN